MNLSVATTALPYISHDNVSFIKEVSRWAEPYVSLCPLVHAQPHLYTAVIANVIARRFIIKGNLRPNGIHSNSVLVFAGTRRGSLKNTCQEVISSGFCITIMLYYML